MDNQIAAAKPNLEQKTEAHKSLTVDHLSLSPADWKAAALAKGERNKLASSAFPLPYTLLDGKIDSRCFEKPTPVTESTNSKHSDSNGRDGSVTRAVDGSIQTPAQRNTQVGFYSQTAKEMFPKSEDARNAAYRVGMYEAGVDNYLPSFFKDKAQIDQLKPGSTKSLVELAQCRKDYQEIRK
jgi:hypothetical protein